MAGIPSPTKGEGTTAEEPTAAGDESVSAAPSSGIVGMTLRLVLSVLLVLAGLASLEGFAKLKVPAVASVCGALHGQRKALGMALLAVGVLCFLRTTVFFFAPHADLLPQLAAMAVGLQLGREALPAAASETVNDLFQSLPRSAELLGFVSLGLGILHLFLAGIVLV
jgi:hypothetical protein